MDSTTQDGHYILVLIKENKVMGYANIYSKIDLLDKFKSGKVLKNDWDIDSKI